MLKPLEKFIKTSNETTRHVISYDEWLDTGEQLEEPISITVRGNNTSLDVDQWLLSDDKRSLSFFAEGGDDGVTYEVVVLVSTTGGQVKEVLLVFLIRDL